MIVCSCFGLSHRDVDAQVARGCRTVRELGRACGAGTDCGSCVADLKARLQRREVPPLKASQQLPLAAK